MKNNMEIRIKLYMKNVKDLIFHQFLSMFSLFFTRFLKEPVYLFILKKYLKIQKVSNTRKL